MKNHEYIKLNDSDNHLSLGNIFRIIKENSNCKNTFLQSELFCAIFNIRDIADSTVNNYLTGFRAINSLYKEKFLSLKNKYTSQPDIFVDCISEIISRLENKVYAKNSATFEKKIDTINNNKKLYDVCKKLYSIAKNDNSVDKSLIQILKELLTKNNLYEFMIFTLSFSILEKKQPIYIENEILETVENTLSSTNISINEIKDFLNMQLQESMWSSLRVISELAKKNNPFACLQMAFFEFYGLIAGYPRYIKSYNFYKISANQNHPAANWAIGFLFYNGYIGNKTEEDYETALKYFNKAQSLGSAAAINSIGLAYLQGKITSLGQSKEKAIEFFQEAIEKNNVFALNNLASIYEDENKFEGAFELYKKSADLGESWAANKIGEFYRLGKAVKKDMKKAFEYYNKSDECSIYFMCPWSKYNLAHYFYETGNQELELEANLPKAIELLEVVSKDILEASEDLLYIYYKIYLESGKKDKNALEKVKLYINSLESSPKFTIEIKNRIEKIMNDIYTNKNKISFNI